MILRIEKCKCTFLLIILIQIVAGCATMKIPDFPKVSVDAYSNIIAKDSLYISARAITEKAELEKYFGTDLSVHNIVPVHLVVENKNDSSSFILMKDQISFNHIRQKDTMLTGGQVDGKSSGGETAVVGGAVSFVLAPVVLVPVLAPVLIFSGFKAMSDSDAIKHNFIVKEFQARTISPGKSIDGFVYFTFPKDNDFLNSWKLILKPMNLSNKSTLDFAMSLNDYKGAN